MLRYCRSHLIALATSHTETAVGRTASLTYPGTPSTQPSGSPTAGFPCRRGDGLPGSSGGWLPQKYVTRSSSLPQPISQCFYSSQPFPTYSHLPLMSPHICAVYQRHWDPCISLAQNRIAESSCNLENTKVFQGAGGQKGERNKKGNHNKK